MAYFHSENRKPGWLVPLLIFAAVFLVFLYGVNTMSGRNASRMKETLETAIVRDITDCYAATGRYPESLQELKERYGLRYDEDRLFVDYRVRGANLRPEFVVLDRSE